MSVAHVAAAALGGPQLFQGVDQAGALLSLPKSLDQDHLGHKIGTSGASVAGPGLFHPTVLPTVLPRAAYTWRRCGCSSPPQARQGALRNMVVREL
jgi:hypothetical protein